MARTRKSTAPAKITVSDTSTTYENPEAVDIFRLKLLVSGLRLEIRCPGMKVSRDVNCHKIAKQEFGLRGTRPEVLAQLEPILERRLRAAVVTDARVNPELPTVASTDEEAANR